MYLPLRLNRFTVVYDVCVLFPASLRDLLRQDADYVRPVGVAVPNRPAAVQSDKADPQHPQ